MHARGLHTEIHAVYSSQFKSWSYQSLISSSNYPLLMVPTNSLPCLLAVRLWSTSWATPIQPPPHTHKPHFINTPRTLPSQRWFTSLEVFPLQLGSPFLLRALLIFPTLIHVKRCNYEVPLYVMFAIPLSNFLKHSSSTILKYVPCTVHSLLFRPTNAQYINNNDYFAQHSNTFRCIYIIFRKTSNFINFTDFVTLAIQENGENYIMRSWKVCTHHPISCGW